VWPLRAETCSSRPGGLVAAWAVPTAAALRTTGLWRSQFGTWGEQLVDQSLKLRGFEVREFKLPGNHGIDRIAVRRGRGSNGAILDMKFVEVKTHRGSTPRLGQTRHGPQMSRKWLADHLRSLRGTANAADRALAKDISRHIKASGKPITHFGELPIGGVLGYFAGSWAGGTAADWYFTSLDAASQRHLGEKLLVLSWSELEQLREATLR
jgi:hypothetical protein